MNNSFNTPVEIVEANMQGAVKKANLPLGKMILLGILAGMFIGLGGESSNLAMHGISDVGLARTLAGLIFSAGLIMIVLIGGELFTGNCLITMAVLDKRVSVGKMIRNLVVVYFSNLVGACFVAAMIYLCGQLDYSGGGLGAFTIKVAVGKVGMSPVKAVLSGIMCNILVCAAILMAGAAKDVVGKIFAIVFPIWVFVISGFEHCVANMFYIPAGIIASQNASYVEKATELYGITAEQINSLSVSGAIHNLIPVTIGNMIGGMVCVGVVFYILNGKKGCDK